MELEGKAVVVTGGAGFIGSALTETLLRLGSRVTVFDSFDDFYNGKEANLDGVRGHPRLRVVKGDILDRRALDESLRGTDLVFHLAAQAGVRYCLERPEKAHEVNATGTFNVLQAARKAKVAKLVYASSSSVYGDPVKVPMDEEHPQRPTSPYAASKLAGEKYCLAFAESYGMNVVCLRYFSVYGPRGRPDQVVTSFTESVSRGTPPTIYGDGSAARDFTFIDDVVDATVLSAMVEEASGETMNIGYGKDVKIGHVASAILEHYGSGFRPRFLPTYAGDFPRTICSNARARRVLGWRPQVSFEEGLKMYLQWYDRRLAERASMHNPPLSGAGAEGGTG